MEQWGLVARMLQAKVGTTTLIKIDKNGASVAEHWGAFMRIFEIAKEKGQRILMTNGQGAVAYQFGGENSPEAVEVIAAPSINVIFYISMTGRVAMTGNCSNLF